MVDPEAEERIQSADTTFKDPPARPHLPSLSK